MIVLAAQPAPDSLVRLSTLVEMLQRSRASIYRDIQRGVIPKPLKQGTSSRWKQSEILAGESGGFCEARRDVGNGRDAGWRLIEAGLNEAAVGPALWAEYRGAVGGTLIPGGDLTGLGAVWGNDPGCAVAGSAVWRPSEVIDGAVIFG